jgi:hypothetical protein
MQAVPVLDKEGNPTGEYQYNGFVANKALELLGREIGMFVERHEVTLAERLTQMPCRRRQRRHAPCERPCRPIMAVAPPIPRKRESRTTPAFKLTFSTKSAESGHS